MKKTDKKCCPYCGDDSGYGVGVRVMGIAHYIGSWQGNDEELGDDTGLSYSRPDSVICQKCGRRVAYPYSERLTYSSSSEVPQ